MLSVDIIQNMHDCHIIAIGQPLIRIEKTMQVDTFFYGHLDPLALYVLEYRHGELA